MAVITLIKMQIAIELGFSSLRLGHRGRKLRGIEAIAFVEASCSLSVLGPVAHADPTKLMFALTATHMVAALILLDTRAAGRTLTSVRQDPIRCLTFVHALFHPLAQLCARRWVMSLLAALKAERAAAEALDSRDPRTQQDLVAAWRRTIAHILAGLYVGTLHVALVLVALLGELSKEVAVNRARDRLQIFYANRQNKI